MTQHLCRADIITKNILMCFFAAVSLFSVTGKSEVHKNSFYLHNIAKFALNFRSPSDWFVVNFRGPSDTAALIRLLFFVYASYALHVTAIFYQAIRQRDNL